MKMSYLILGNKKENNINNSPDRKDKNNLKMIIIRLTELKKKKKNPLKNNYYT